MQKRVISFQLYWGETFQNLVHFYVLLVDDPCLLCCPFSLVVGGNDTRTLVTGTTYKEFDPVSFSFESTIRIFFILLIVLWNRFGKHTEKVASDTTYKAQREFPEQKKQNTSRSEARRRTRVDPRTSLLLRRILLCVL
jgi:hypothetical protein